MSDFFLDEYIIRVLVCGESYWVVDLDANVSSDQTKAFRFHCFGAGRFASEHFPNELTDCIMVVPNQPPNTTKPGNR